ncbi:Uncharacterised protein [Nocardia farcinica]|uniref:hypothetical protein n=1 Tax=Nocardia farcinica TaxID=37329 RepID=UPI000E05E51D|nr:hypothetical protein [Nocardia farcinica]SUE28456.1 Uncharacterised protein [Nocardia farcinica]
MTINTAARDGHAGTPPAAPTEPTNADLRRDVRAATRSGRYALVAALCAAVVSSGIAAGSAVYVSSTELQRKERAEVAQVVRDNRQRAYSDYAAAMMRFMEGLSGLEGELLQEPIEREEVRAQVVEVGDSVAAMSRAQITVSLVGNLDVAPIIVGFNEEHAAPFLHDRLTSFARRHLGGAPEPVEAMREEAPVMIADIERTVTAATACLSRFVDLARLDLGLTDG